MQRPYKPKPKIKNIDSIQTGQYNKAYEEAKKGIIPSNVIRSYNKQHPEKKQEKKEIKPFELKDVANLMTYSRPQSKKVLKLSLFSRAELYDTLRPSYQIR